MMATSMAPSSGRGSLAGQRLDDLVEDVARAVTVRRRDGPGLPEPERPELVDLVVAVGRVHLVDREEGRACPRA